MFRPRPDARYAYPDAAAHGHADADPYAAAGDRYPDADSWRGNHSGRRQFPRTLSGSWGSASTGGAYSVCCTSANFSVSGGNGHIANPSTNLVQTATLLGVQARDVNMAVRVTATHPPAGANAYAYLILRRVSSSTYYLARLRFAPTGQALVQVFRRTATATDALGTEVAVSGLTVGTNTPIMVRAEAFGALPTLRMRAWAAGQPEPAAWQFTFADTGPTAIQPAGAVAIMTYVSTAVTNGPITFNFAALSATNAP